MNNNSGRQGGEGQGNSHHGEQDSAVRLDQVSKQFKERKVLEDVSFEVPAGEALCVLGRSGTGKSVLLKMLIGLLRADHGKVLIQGEDMTCLDEEGLSRVRRRMGYMFQNAALGDSFTLHDNLALPLRRLARNKDPDDIERKIKEVLEQVGLGKDGEKMPAALSGGMLKRAGLARALMLQPQILLADEPHSGLDRITATEITDLLLSVKHDRHTTMVIVTHDLENAHRIADRFAVLDQGKLVGIGTPDDLAKSDNETVKKLVTG